MIIPANLLDQFLPLVQKPARYTGGELNSIVKNWESTPLKVAVAFPDVYEVGMSNLAIQIIYGLLNSQETLLCERVFSPWPDMEEQLRQAKIPLFSLETRRPLQEFDLLGVSLSYELSYTNVLNLLDLSGIPVRRVDRGEEHPLVFGGGHSAMNPEPMTDFMDFFILGEAEEVLLEITSLLLIDKKKGKNKNDILADLANIPGVYVSALRNSAKRRMVKDLENAYFPLKPVVPSIATVHDRASLEIMRGCFRHCRFCQAGYVLLPKRERSVKLLVEQARAILDNTGYDTLGLLSLSTSDYSKIEELAFELDKFCRKRNVALSLPSLRMNTLSPKLIQLVQSYSNSSVTLAPEAGSQRLRDHLHKGITEEDIFKSVQIAKEGGAKSAKLYFMIGLPTETDEDIDGIVHLAFELRSIMPVTISVSNFIPKPHTPFQRAEQDGFKAIERKQRFLKQQIKGRNLQFRWYDAKLSVLEGVLSRGDRSMGAVIQRAWELGCRFDAWDDQLKWPLWEQVLREQDQSGAAGLDEVTAKFLRARPADEALPWDIIDTMVPKGQLELLPAS